MLTREGGGGEAGDWKKDADVRIIQSLGKQKNEGKMQKDMKKMGT